MATGVAVPPDKQRITQVESCSGTATESVAVAVGERMSATTFPGQLDGCSSVAAAVCAEAVAEQEPGLQIVRKGRAGSAISTCSVGGPGGSSGASTATGERDGSVSVIAHSQGENSSFYDGVGPSRGPVGPDQGGQNCSVAAVLKRQALLAAIGLQHSPKSDRLYLQSHACAILHFIGENLRGRLLRLVPKTFFSEGCRLLMHIIRKKVICRCRTTYLREVYYLSRCTRASVFVCSSFHVLRYARHPMGHFGR